LLRKKQGLRDDVRTWIQDRREYFAIPELVVHGESVVSSPSGA
jgi:hypothetical protein